jgi:hypothetical protein
MRDRKSEREKGGGGFSYINFLIFLVIRITVQKSLDVIRGNKMPANKTKDRKLFWVTLPGILTGVAAIITAIGGLLVGLNSVGLLNPQPTATSMKNEWAIPYTYEFPTGFWKEGNYEYVIEASCPGTNSSAKGNSLFTVSKKEVLSNKNVFIRYTGLYDDLQKTNLKFNGIHPDQKTTASYTIIAQNENDIVQKINACVITFSYSFEGQPYTEITLTPGSAFPYP